MKLAMLAQNPALYSHQRLLEAARARGHELNIFKTLRITINIASGRPTLVYGGQHLESYEAVIPGIGALITKHPKRMNHCLPC